VKGVKKRKFRVTIGFMQATLIVPVEVIPVEAPVASAPVASAPPVDDSIPAGGEKW